MTDDKRNKYLFLVMCGMLVTLVVLLTVFFTTKPPAVQDNPAQEGSGTEDAATTEPEDTNVTEPEAHASPKPTQRIEGTAIQEPDVPTGDAPKTDETELATTDDTTEAPPGDTDGTSSRLSVSLGAEQEYRNADHAHWSDTIYVTVFRQETSSGAPYLLTHVILRDPSQIRLGRSSEELNGEKRHLVEYARDHDFVIGINASEAVEDFMKIRQGAYICDGQVLQDMPTTGNELCIWSDGSLSAAAAGTPANELVSAGVMYTAISGGPVLIRNGIAEEGLNPESISPKTAIGVVSPCEYYIVTASDGDYISDVHYQDILDVLLSKGCAFSKCLSDGPNVTLVMDGQLLNETATGNPRRILDYILFVE